MMSKIRKLLSKFKKQDNHSDSEYEYDSEYDSEYDEVVDENKSKELNSTTTHASSDNTLTGDFDQSIDLNNEISWKDSLQIKLQRLKDYTGRFSIKNFRKIVPSNNATGQKDSVHKKIKSLNFSNFYNNIFTPSLRTPINKSFQIAMVLMSLYLFINTLAKFISGKKDYKMIANNNAIDIDRTNELNANNLNQIKLAKVFQTDKAKPIDPKKRIKPELDQVLICKKASKKTRLPIKLINTIVLQDTVKSIASVQVRSTPPLSVREGDKIDNMAEVGKIDRMGMIIKNLKEGTCEKIESSNQDTFSRRSPISVMTPSQSKTFKKQQKKISGINNDGNNFTVDKNFLKEKMSDISNILTQARGIQINNPDGSLSFKVVDIEPGGIFSYLGIQDNDVITSINGKKINDLNEVMGLFSKITTLDQLNLTVTRGGDQVPLEYKFK